MSDSEILIKEIAEQYLKAPSFHLGEYTSIDDSAAQVLAQHEGELRLWRITKLSDAAAQAFATHKGGLDFRELTSLSDSPGHVQLASKLAKQKWSIDLCTLESIGEVLAQSLAQRRGDLHLDGLTSLSDATAHALALHTGKLWLSGLTSLSDSPGHVQLASKLAKQKGCIDLNKLKCIGEAAAQALALHKGGLSLDGLTNLSDAAVQALAHQSGELCLGLTSLSEAAAQSLALHQGNLQLLNLTSLSDAAASYLAKHKGRIEIKIETIADTPGFLALVKSLVRFAKRSGDLWLDQVTEIGDAAAVELAKHKGRLYLRGLKTLSDTAAEAFARCEGEIHLDGKVEKDLNKKRLSNVLSKDKIESFIIRNNLSPVKSFGTINDDAARILNQLEVDGEVHAKNRCTIANPILAKVQIKASESQRPISIIRQSPKNLNRFIKKILPSISDEHGDGVVTDLLCKNIKAYCEQSDFKCVSYHFPMPRSINEKIETTFKSDEWEKIVSFLLSWSKDILGAIDADYIDVENITEDCGEGLSFIKRHFKKRYVSHIELSEAEFQVRMIGSEIGIIHSYFSEKISSCKWTCPQHEISDLFNRALPSDKTLVYFDQGANGLFVLLETPGMEEVIAGLYE